MGERSEHWAGRTAAKDAVGEGRKGGPGDPDLGRPAGSGPQLRGPDCDFSPETPGLHIPRKGPLDPPTGPPPAPTLRADTL